MFNRLLVLVLSLMLGSAMFTASAQEGISRKQQERNLAKKAKEEKKARVKQDKEDRKHHLGLQDKATQKRMKRNSKRADRSGSRAHRDGPFRRMFQRKR
jgi:Flp pilus assembly protein TadB